MLRQPLPQYNGPTNYCSMTMGEIQALMVRKVTYTQVLTACFPPPKVWAFAHTFLRERSLDTYAESFFVVALLPPPFCDLNITNVVPNVYTTYPK